MHRIGEKRRLTAESSSDILYLTESPPEKKSCVRRESSANVSAKSWFQRLIQHLSHWLADMIKPESCATSKLNDCHPDSKVYNSDSELGPITSSCSPISHIASTSLVCGGPAAGLGTSTPRGEDPPFSPTAFFSKPTANYPKFTQGVNRRCDKDAGFGLSIRVSTNSSPGPPRVAEGGGSAAGLDTSTACRVDHPFSPTAFFSKPASNNPKFTPGACSSYAFQASGLPAQLPPKTSQNSPPQMADTSSKYLRSLSNPAGLYGCRKKGLANGIHLWHQSPTVTASNQVVTIAAPAPLWSRPRVSIPSTPALSTAEERSEQDSSSARASSPGRDRHDHVRHSSRRHEVNSLTAWMDDFKFDMKHLQAERQVIIGVAERKLQLYQKQRMAVEDVLVGRLRQSLSDSHLSLDQEPSWMLSPGQMEQVTMAIRGGRNDACLSERYRIRISRSDLCTLTGTVWLNDEVINFYFNMIQECCSVAGVVQVHVFNSFFYTKLSQTGYAGVRRWTKKVDVLQCDLILLPVHLGMHWCLAIIDLKGKQFLYLDSLLGHNTVCLDRLRNYLKCESEDKKKVTLDLSAWTNHIPNDIPQQENSSDCGVFMCMYARHKAMQLPFNFSQDDMPKMRNLMIFEVLQQRLTSHPHIM